MGGMWGVFRKGKEAKTLLRSNSIQCNRAVVAIPVGSVIHSTVVEAAMGASSKKENIYYLTPGLHIVAALVVKSWIEYGP